MYRGMSGKGTNVDIRLPANLKPVVAALPQTQKDLSKITELAETVVAYAPYILVGGAVLIAITVLLRKK